MIISAIFFNYSWNEFICITYNIRNAFIASLHSVNSYTNKSTKLVKQKGIITYIQLNLKTFSLKLITG